MPALKLKVLEPSESSIQAAILRFLRVCRAVAWAERFNTGAMKQETKDARTGKLKRRFVRFAFPGCSDILGQMKDGRFLAIEVKTSTGRATEEQEAFLQRVAEHGGVAILARSLGDVVERMTQETAATGAKTCGV